MNVFKKEVKMEIEIVDFYPVERNDAMKKLIGTIHAYLPELGIDLRGVYVQKKGNQIFIGLPNKKTIDLDTKELVIYPIFNFMDKKKNDDLKDSLIKAGREYIIKEVLSKPSKPFKLVKEGNHTKVYEKTAQNPNKGHSRRFYPSSMKPFRTS